MARRVLDICPYYMNHYVIIFDISLNEGGDRFEIVDFRKFDGPVTFTLTLDDLEYYIIRFVSSTSIHSTTEHVEFHCERTDVHLNWFY